MPADKLAVSALLPQELLLLEVAVHAGAAIRLRYQHRQSQVPALHRLWVRREGAIQSAQLREGLTAHHLSGLFDLLPGQAAEQHV